MKGMCRHFGLLLALLLLAGQAGAGEVIGNTYIGERFGYIELVSVGGKWEVVDREKDAQNDMAGPVADFRLKEPVAGVKPIVFNVWGFRKADASITVDFIIQTLRNAWGQQGGEVESVEAGRLSGRKAWFLEKRVTFQGRLAHGRDIVVEGDKAIFVISTVALAPAYPQVRQLLEELAATAKY